MPLKQLSKLIKKAAQKELLPRFKQCESSFKKDGSFLTEADLAVQDYLQNQLKILWPEYGFLAEEMSDEVMQEFLNSHSSGFWCLDPIDGTSNFAAGLPYFSISLALIKNSRVELGLVYDPIRDECFSAQREEGAWLNNHPLEVSEQQLPLAKSLAIIDLKRLEPSLRQKLVLEPPYHSQRSLGSVALDWCWLAAERAQVYLHGRQKIWDYAAGLLIAQEAGCMSMSLDGEPVFQLNLEARQAIGAVSQTLFSEWSDYLSDYLPK